MRKDVSREQPVVAKRPAVFTAMDGTFLDFDSFRAVESMAVARRLAADGIPLIPVTVMTIEEIEPLAREMGLRHAMIVEAGGAIARWKDDAWKLDARGTDADALLEVIAAIELRSGADLTVYSVLPDADAAFLSGRSGDMLRSSTRRSFSEPFLIERGDLEEVTKAAAALGFTVRRGRRFYHLTRAGAESEAFQEICRELRCDLAISLGGSPVDLEFLRRSDVPIVVPLADGSVDPELLERFCRAYEWRRRRDREAGPRRLTRSCRRAAGHRRLDGVPE